jgi:quercetin dioxygenase-like cupin family protein
MRRLVVVAAVAALTLVPITATAAAGPPRTAPPGTFWYREDARALAEQTGALQVKAGKQVVVQTHILGPGFRAPWHTHPDFSLVLMRRGALTVRYSCNETETWLAGRAYLNRPQETAVNEGQEPVELVVVYFNVPSAQPAGLIPAGPAVPPTGCPL